MKENKCVNCNSNTVTKNFIMNTELNIKQPICKICIKSYDGEFKISSYRPYDCCQAEDCTSVSINKIIDDLRFCKIHNLTQINEIKVLYRKDNEKTHKCMCLIDGVVCSNKSLYYYISQEVINDKKLVYLICNEHSTLDSLKDKNLVKYITTRICLDISCVKTPSFHHINDDTKHLKYCSTHVPKDNTYINIKSGRFPKK